MDISFQNELLLHKKKVGVVQEELQVQKKQQIDVDEVHNSKLSLIKKQLSKTNKDLQELEVTNGELKEEVSLFICVKFYNHIFNTYWGFINDVI